MNDQITATIRAWIAKNGLPKYQGGHVRITTFEYDHQGEKIDVDLVWIRSRNRYERIEYEFNGKLIKVQL